MQIINHAFKQKIARSIQKTSCTIGNFDGLHLGHQSLIHKTTTYAREHGLQSLALSFDPAPERFFRKDVAEPRLFTTSQKLRAFAELGIDLAVIEAFDEDFSKVSPNQFVQDYLIKTLGVKHLAIGDNFRFGCRRGGDVTYLQSQKSADFSISVCEAVKVGSASASSSRIRADVAKGDMRFVNELLGRPYLLEGKLRKGRQLGRLLGFPTLNLHDIKQLTPPAGVYACYAVIGDQQNSDFSIMARDSRALPAVVNIGYRPSVSDENKLSIEAHIIDQKLPVDGIYDRPAGIYFLQKLRDEKKFPNQEELKRAIAEDIQHARSIF